MALAVHTSELMPKGKPAFAAVKYYPSIDQLHKQHGTQVMLSVLFVLVKDFCASLNVVRNMTEDQMIEAAQMLLDECEGFRLEDYVMMLTMAKRGQLSVNGGKGIMDRMDLEVMGKLMDAYYSVRRLAGQKIQEEETVAVEKEIDSKTVVFAPVVEDAMTAWRKQSEQAAKEEERRREEESRERIREQQARTTQFMVHAFAGRIAAGEKLTAPRELEFYNNNAAEIEAALTLIRESKNR